MVVMSCPNRFTVAVACAWSFACLAPACGDDGGASPDAEVVDTNVSEVALDAAAETGGDTGIDRDTLIQPEVETSEVVAPLEAPEGEWTWFDQPGSACSDGSETGFAVNRGTNDDVLVVFMGGGACWDFNTCFLFSTAAKGPFQKAQFDAVAAGISIGILDRDDDANPYRSWTQVFVPYCTGDLHAGDRVMSYTAGGLTNEWHHSGAVNARLLLARVAATFARPDHLVVAGLSAGGFGATLQYAAFRDAFMASTSQLVDDSGPFLIANAIPPAFRNAWFTNWRLDQRVDPICGQDCKDDLAAFYPALAARYPSDRMALVSSLQDEVIAGYFTMLQPQFEIEIRKLARDVLAPLDGWRTFLIAGNSHTTLGSPAAFKTQDVDLRTWLTRMVAGDPTWTNLTP